MKRLVGALLLLLVLVGTVGVGQTVPKNPRGLAFESVDHAQLTAYEVDIVRQADGVLIQTLSVAQSATRVVGSEIEVDVNVMPVAFGRYVFRARALAGTAVSETSLDSPAWDRVPGRPTNIVIRAGS